MARWLGIMQKVAWKLCHAVREMMDPSHKRFPAPWTSRGYHSRSILNSKEVMHPETSYNDLREKKAPMPLTILKSNQNPICDVGRHDQGFLYLNPGITSNPRRKK
jgi:hypothetical protein